MMFSRLDDDGPFPVKWITNEVIMESIGKHRIIFTGIGPRSFTARRVDHLSQWWLTKHVFFNHREASLHYRRIAP